jgi:cysteinyl-tRNA synthetase
MWPRLRSRAVRLGLDSTRPLRPRPKHRRRRRSRRKRWAAKQAKDFAAADALRAEIGAAGWQMLDRKDGYSLECR